MTDRPDESLVAAADAALRASTARTVLIEHGGERYVAKRIAAAPTAAGAGAVRALAGQARHRPVAADAGAAAVGSRVQRRLRGAPARALAQAGVRVPRIVHHGAGYLLLEHCGTTVASVLEGWTVETCRSELLRLADELGAFHRAGQWHGAAQIKNLTRKDGQTWRIDFEENFGELVPLPAAQALDVVLFLNSVSLAGPLDEDRGAEAAARAAARLLRGESRPRRDPRAARR